MWGSGDDLQGAPMNDLIGVEYQRTLRFPDGHVAASAKKEAQVFTQQQMTPLPPGYDMQVHWWRHSTVPHAQGAACGVTHGHKLYQRKIGTEGERWTGNHGLNWRPAFLQLSSEHRAGIRFPAPEIRPGPAACALRDRPDAPGE